MKGILILTVTFVVNVLAYHDPDLNYHLSQVQKLDGCDQQGYSYPAPAVQLSPGVKTAPSGILSAPGYSSNTGYASNGGYASNAGYASNGGYASNSGYATNGGYASNAGYASNGGYASNSGYATNGGYASNAGYASNGGYASQSGFASQGYSSNNLYASNGGTGYSSGITYQAPALQSSYLPSPPQSSYLPSAPQNSFLPAAPQSSYLPAANTYQLQNNYAPAPTYATQVQNQQQEVHGYATSAGLSAAASAGRTVIPQATYAQAPILAKITGAPLIAKFAQAPAKTTYVTQNLAAQQAYAATGSSAKASLNSYSTVQTGGPVVTQVFAATPAKYAASPALRVQQVHQQLITPARYTAISGSTTVHAQAAPISGLTPVAQVAPQYRGQAQYVSTVSHVSTGNAGYAAPIAQYSAPAVSTHYSHQPAQVVTQHYSAPAVQYSAPVSKAAQVVSHYSAPAGAQYTSVSSGAHYASPVVSHVSAPAVTHVAAPAVTHVAAPTVHHAGQAKNVHTEFLDNYDAHPRYAYEYAVNDPHTGDIKQQKEERDGEVVKGQYSLVEPDGSVRTVNYHADWETGFHADVRNSKDSHH